MAEGNSKHKVLVRCRASLVTHFAASDLRTIATELSSVGLVPDDLYSELLAVQRTPEVNAQNIILAITRTVKAEALKYVDLVVVLKKQGMPELAKILQEELSTLLFHRLQP